MNKAEQIPWYKHRVAGLTVCCPAGEHAWREFALAYWQGALPGLQRVRSSPFAVVSRGPGPDKEIRCYFKRYLMRNLKDRVKHVFLPSRASRAHAGAERLNAHGFRAPRDICIIEERRLGVVTGSALVTEAAECPSVRELLETYSSVPAPQREKRQLLAALGRELGRMHGSGLHHGDTNLGNILVQRHGDTFEFLWLDNERVRKFAEVSVERRVENLRQLNKESYFLTARDRIYFWIAYRSWSRLTAADAAAVLRAAARVVEAYWEERKPQS